MKYTDITKYFIIWALKTYQVLIASKTIIDNLK